MKSSEIFDAVEQNDLEKVKILIENRGVLPNITENGKTLPHIAIWKGYLDILKYLLEKDTLLLNMKVSNLFHLGYCTLLDFAVEGGDLKIVKYLVENHNADIYEVFHEKWTAVNWAVIKGHLNITKYFIDERNVDVNEPPVKKHYNNYLTKFQPLLFDAVEYKRDDIITYLIEEKRANLTVVDSFNENVLYMAVRKGNLDFMKYILDEKKAKIDINWRNAPDNYTLLHVIATNWLRNDEIIIKYLIRGKHADPSIPVGKERRTALHLAVVGENAGVIIPLIDCGADMEQQDINGNTALHLAVSGRRGMRFNMCKDLCERGADVNQKNKKGKTPLQLLLPQFSEDDVEVCKVLVKHGANVNLTDKKGNTLLHVAVMRNQMSFLEYLVQDKRVDANTPREGDDWTPLHCAVFCDHFEICKYLSDHGANVNQKNKRDETPLDIALGKLSKRDAHRSNRRTFKICKLLVENGASINSSDKLGSHLIHIAAMKNDCDFLDYLVREKHVDINTPRETDGWTPLHLAAMSDHFEICKYLIEHGAKIRTKSKLGKIPSEVASNQKIIDYLENPKTIKRTRRNLDNLLTALPQNLPFREYRYQRISDSISFLKDDSIFGFQYFFSYITLLMRYFVNDSTDSTRARHQRILLSTAEILHDKIDPIATNVIDNYFSNFTDA